MINDFKANLEFSLEIERHFFHPFITSIASQGRFFPNDKGDRAGMILQRRAIDGTYRDHDHAIVTVEFKIDTHYFKPGPLTMFFETESCTAQGHERDGWGRTAQSDLLLYGFVTSENPRHVSRVHLYVIDFQALLLWAAFNVYSGRYRYHVLSEQNRTAGYIVPMSAICAAVRTEQYLLACDDSGGRPYTRLGGPPDEEVGPLLRDTFRYDRMANEKLR